MFATDETIWQQILAFSPRLGAKRETATWSQESLMKEEADGAVASKMGNIFQRSDAAKGMQQLSEMMRNLTFPALLNSCN